MRKHELCAAMLAAVLIAGFTGCSSDDGPTTPPSANLSAQEADDVALQTLVTVGIFGDDLGGAIGSTPAAPFPFGAHRTPTLAVRPNTTLWDTTFTTGNGLVYSASRTFFDASDVALPDYGPTATRVHWTSQASGLITGPRD